MIIISNIWPNCIPCSPPLVFVKVEYFKATHRCSISSTNMRLYKIPFQTNCDVIIILSKNNVLVLQNVHGIWFFVVSKLCRDSGLFKSNSGKLQSSPSWDFSALQSLLVSDHLRCFYPLVICLLRKQGRLSWRLEHPWDLLLSFFLLSVLLAPVPPKTHLETDLTTRVTCHGVSSDSWRLYE